MAEVVVGDSGNSDLLAGALQSFVAPRNLYDAILAPCFVSPKAFQQGLHVWKDRDPSNLTVLRAGFRMAANHDFHPLPVNVIPGHPDRLRADSHTSVGEKLHQIADSRSPASAVLPDVDRKSTRLNSSHLVISY